MDRLTAIRTFAKPSFTPTRHVKIFSDRWYMVRFQNVERDPRFDYVGLGDGEYTVLLPGNKAREARDARLNHCNGITEHVGRVYALYITRYGRMREDAEFFPDIESMHARVLACYREHETWLADCAKALRDHVAKYQAKPEDWRMESILGCTAVIAQNQDSFDYRVEVAR